MPLPLPRALELFELLAAFCFLTLAFAFGFGAIAGAEVVVAVAVVVEAVDVVPVDSQAPSVSP